MSMEIKVNKDIAQYTESVFWGLSLRQIILGVLAIGAAVGAFFGLRGIIHSKDLLSMVTVVAAAPIAAAAFFRPQGMPLERYVLAWLLSMLYPYVIAYKAENGWYREIQKLQKRQRAQDRRDRLKTLPATLWKCAVIKVSQVFKKGPPKQEGDDHEHSL